MGLFRPYERSKSAAKAADDGLKPTPSTEIVTDETPKSSSAQPEQEAKPTKIAVKRQPQKKKSATRSRKQAEAERMERLHPSRTPKEQRRADREARAKNRMDSWEKLESSPERVLVRDYVDTRWTITEFLLPVMILVMAGVMATAENITLSSYIALSLWVLLAASFIQTFIMWRGFKRLLSSRVPKASTRGLLLYMFNRAMMIRRFRRPSPRIKRGDPI